MLSQIGARSSVKLLGNSCSKCSPNC